MYVSERALSISLSPMESTLSVTTINLLAATSKTLNPTSKPSISSANRPTQYLRSQLVYIQLRRPKALVSVSHSSNPLRSFCSVALPAAGSRLERVGSSVASLASAAGGGGDGAADAGEAKSNSIVGGSDKVSALSSDAIIIDVGGMMCDGCAGSVKRILESQPQVSSASVNLATETAVLWPVSEVKAIPNWQKDLGETLSKHLTNCGFKSNFRGQVATEGDPPS